jgi:4-hydroxy-L-threonine phosphate dehydrogenase PdxA
MKKICVTSGDPDGIGLEVSVKALLEIGPRKPFLFYLFCNSDIQDGWVRKLKKKFSVDIADSWPAATRLSVKGHKSLIIVANRHSPHTWVETAALACQSGAAAALVTGPMSKKLVNGIVQGHTEILGKISRMRPNKDLFMGFVGNLFSVVLATSHIPISLVPSSLTSEALVQAGIEAERIGRIGQSKYAKKKKLRIVYLGLNPHAGEGGQIGDEETRLILPAIESLKGMGVDATGPISADSAFIDLSFYNVFVAMYHDQGLIPFKTLHNWSGVQLTLGLPFVRTSVDHGTATNLFGKNKAQWGSMREAIELAMELS